MKECEFTVRIQEAVNIIGVDDGTIHGMVKRGSIRSIGQYKKRLLHRGDVEAIAEKRKQRIKEGPIQWLNPQTY